MLLMHCGKTRYNHALEAVVTYTEELAYKQAKEADKLLAQGVYLGTSLFLLMSSISCTVMFACLFLAAKSLFEPSSFIYLHPAV